MENWRRRTPLRQEGASLFLTLDTGPRLRREPEAPCPGVLWHRMGRSIVDLLALQRLADDLAYAPWRQTLLAGGLVIRPSPRAAERKCAPAAMSSLAGDFDVP